MPAPTMGVWSSADLVPDPGWQWIDADQVQVVEIDGCLAVDAGVGRPERDLSGLRVDQHREDLIDALLCAWTASLWARHGLIRCQVLGLPVNPDHELAATIIAAARPEQRSK